MRYINGLHEGETIRNVYLCKGKRSAETRNGKPYDNLILQDKTGTLDGKVWDPNSQGIADYDEKGLYRGLWRCDQLQRQSPTQHQTDTESGRGRV